MKNKTVTEKICRSCLHRWMPRVANPLKCPKCGCLRKVAVVIGEAVLENSDDGRNSEGCAPEYYGYVYILENVRDKSNPMVKIGHTTDPIRRLLTVKSIYGVETGRVYLSKLTADYKVAEHETHKRFKDGKVYGEWFNSPFEEVKKYLNSRKIVNLTEAQVEKIDIFQKTGRHQELDFERHVKPILTKHGMSVATITRHFRMKCTIAMKKRILGPYLDYTSVRIKEYVRDKTDGELFS